jgi:hypothetical protein
MCSNSGGSRASYDNLLQHFCCPAVLVLLLLLGGGMQHTFAAKSFLASASSFLSVAT